MTQRAKNTAFSDNASNYVDEGCDLGGVSCLRCPLPKCRHEMSKGELDGFKLSGRNAIILQALATGMKVTQVASVYKVNVRTIFRIKAQAA